MNLIKYQQIKNQQVTDSVRNLIMGHVWIFQPDKNPTLKNNTKMGHWAQNQASAGHSCPLTWPCRRWVSELKRRSCESEDLEWFWMKEWSLVSGQVFSDLNPVEDEWVKWRQVAVNLKDLEWFWMKEWSLISCQVFSDLNPVEDEWTEEKKLWIWRSGVILDEGMVSDLVSGVLWPEPCRRWVRWTEEKKLWIWRSGVILDEGMVSDLGSGVIWPEPCRRWVSELKRRSCESEDLEWFWMKEWSLVSGQVFSDLNPVEDEWVNWRGEAVNLKDLEWFWMKEWSLISGQVFSDLNPVEDEWGELKRRSCESEDLEWFWMKEWSLISCQVFSDLNPGEDNWGELKRRSCESEDLEWFWMKEWSLVSGQVFSDLNPVEAQWGELKRRSCESEGSGVILDEEMVSDLRSGVLWPEPCRRWVRWTEEKKLWIWRSGVILDEGMVSDLGSGVLWPEPCRTWVSELKRRSCESEDLEWFWMKEWSLISGQGYSDLNPVEDEWVKWREAAVNLKDLEWFWMKEWSLISGQVFSDPNPVEDNWTEEKKLWIWRSGVILDEGMVSDLGSGVIWPEPCRRWVSELKRRSCESEDLEWFWMKEWSLISCQVFSDLNPVEDEWGELKRRNCESEDLEWFWMKEWSLISCQVFSDLNPVEDEWVNWREEAVNLKIWSDSGWRNGLWSRVRCSLTWTLEKMSEVNWREEAVNLKIWSDSEWRNGLWSWVRCSLTWTL